MDTADNTETPQARKPLNAVFNDISGILFASLSAFPEARKAVAAALLDYERRGHDGNG